MGNTPKYEPYIKIPTKLFDAFCDYVRNDKTMTRTEIMLWLKIMRDTYGYRCTEHLMTDEYLANALGVRTEWIKKSKKKMRERNLIAVSKDLKGRCVLSLRDNTNDWSMVGVPQYHCTTVPSVPQYSGTTILNGRCTTVPLDKVYHSTPQYIIEEEIKEEKIKEADFLFLRDTIKNKFPDVYEPSDDETVLKTIYESPNWKGAIPELTASDAESYQYKNVKEAILNDL